MGPLATILIKTNCEYELAKKRSKRQLIPDIMCERKKAKTAPLQ